MKKTLLYNGGWSKRGDETRPEILRDRHRHRLPPSPFPTSHWSISSLSGVRDCCANLHSFQYKEKTFTADSMSIVIAILMSLTAPSRPRFLPHKNDTHPGFCLFCLSTSLNFRTHNKQHSHLWPSIYIITSSDSSLVPSLSVTYCTPSDHLGLLHFHQIAKLPEWNKVAKSRTLEAPRECKPPPSPHFFYIVDFPGDNCGNWSQNLITYSWNTINRSRKFHQNPFITFR